ncbi:hypothetical protein ACKVEX_05610 [Rhodocyclaceae bacterium SMB388]
MYAKAAARNAAPRSVRSTMIERDSFGADGSAGSGGAKRWVGALLIIGAIAAGAYFVHADRQAKEAERAANLDSLERVQRVAEKWDDAIKVLEVTPRLAASGPIGALQAIHRDLRNMSVTSCVVPARDALATATGFHLEAVMSILRNDEQRAQQMGERYVQEMQAFSEITLDCR